MPLQVKAPTQEMLPYEKIVYVIDVSCSMSSHLDDAIQATRVFGNDGFRASVITFTDSHVQWEGQPEHVHEKEKDPCGRRCIPVGWVELPRHHDVMMRHLGSISASGGTNPTSALSRAIKDAPPSTLVVFISDGEFNHKDAEDPNGGVVLGPASIIKAAMAWRRSRNLAPVQVLVWAVTEADSQRESLVELAKLGGGGLWRPDTRLSGPW
jgi:Mg-chelatase subunit ChlD